MASGLLAAAATVAASAAERLGMVRIGAYRRDQHRALILAFDPQLLSSISQTWPSVPPPGTDRARMYVQRAASYAAYML